jgi:hypothetical protein
VTPNSGTTAGGTSVTIGGTNFVSGATVSFGGTAATGVTVVNATTITATTPAHAAGAVIVVVTNPGGLSGTLPNGFTYVPPPTVSGVLPNSGPTAGGTGVTISGTNFIAGATVTFGGTAATGVTVVNATTITATTPAHAAGAVNVVVTIPVGGSGTLPNGFTYVPPPTVIGVLPNSGPIAGGTGVTISGTNFLPGATVSFGGTAATGVTVVNATTITATTPAHAAGAVNVVVTIPVGGSGTLSNGFTYLGPAPTVTNVTPGSGLIFGGTAVTISGTNFAGGADVKFDGTDATNVTVVNSTTITADTPAGGPGAVNVEVENPDSQNGTLNNGFTYIDPLTAGACGGQLTLSALTESGNALTLDITNNSGSTITLTAMSIDWNVATAVRILDEYLGGTAAANLIGNANETASPSIFPVPNSFTGPIGRREIGGGASKMLYINFQAAPTGSVYTVQVYFDGINCQASASK